MSDESKPLPPLQVDLSELRLMPSWVANFGTQPSHAHADEDENPRERRGRDRDRGDFRGGGGGAGGAGGAGPRRFDRGGERRPGGGPSAGGDRPRGDRPPGKFGRRDDRGAPAPRFQDDRPQMPSGLKVTVEAEDKALEALAQHVKQLGRAFSVFDAARLVLAGPERHRVKVECEAERLVGLYSVPGDGALFETKEEALRYLLRSPEAIAPYYTTEEIEVEEPKGVFTSIAICGMSGEVLGPPSHHSYQASLKRLHNERFSSLPFEEYRRRVRVDSSPEAMEKWKAEQKKATRWTYLKGEVVEGQEPLSFTSRADFESHFRRTHGDDAVVEVREAIVHGVAKREQLSAGLGRLLRRNIEDAKKHLFEVSQKIAHGLERRGLKLFKRRGGKMFVSRVKPRALDAGTVFSERITAIVEQIRNEPGLLISKVIEAIAPSPAEAAPAPAAPAVEGAEPTAAADNVKHATEEQKSVMRDLHWLAEEGYVIIYSDDVLFLGVQGEPPHHTPEAKAQQAAAAAAEAPADPAAETPSEAEAEAESQAEAKAIAIAESKGETPAPTPAPSAEIASAVEEAPAVVAEAPVPTEEEEKAAAGAAEVAAPDPSGAD